MRKPTEEQQAILESNARIRVVRAVPGSGKTWLVAELIRQELSKWPTRNSGVAALSFTRVGGGEIRKAVGHELGHPHFVGTIDAFLFRYVVRPFLQNCFPSLAAPRLIPSAWGAEHWGNYQQNLKAANDQGINLFGCVFVDEINGKAVIAHKPRYTPRLQRLGNKESANVKKAKLEMWKQSGRLTHSDAALWASKILGHETLGSLVRAEIIRRFPLIIVDELQDTGYFLGKSILLLLEECAVRGVVVGDPDQAIYEFTGARPDLFNRFESIAGAVSLPLPSSRRCPTSVATTASFLKDSGGSISVANCNMGKTFLVRYSDLAKDIPRVVDAAVKGQSTITLKVIARQTSTVTTLIGRSAKPVPKLGCPTLNHMYRAVVMFNQGRQVSSLAIARSALDLLIFEYEGVEDGDLEKHGIDPMSWKKLAADCLLRACSEMAIGNVYDWQTKVGEILDQEFSKFGFAQPLQFTPGKLKPKKINDWDKACADYLPQGDLQTNKLVDIPVQTVHGVKGETHDVTIFVCPEPRKVQHCPSIVWWSENEEGREEKRIAYVAMTRAQGDLIVCVSEACYQRLSITRPQFVASFECLTVEQFIAQTRRLEKPRVATN